MSDGTVNSWVLTCHWYCQTKSIRILLVWVKYICFHVFRDCEIIARPHDFNSYFYLNFHITIYFVTIMFSLLYHISSFSSGHDSLHHVAVYHLFSASFNGGSPCSRRVEISNVLFCFHLYCLFMPRSSLYLFSLLSPTVHVAFFLSLIVLLYFQVFYLRNPCLGLLLSFQGVEFLRFQEIWGTSCAKSLFTVTMRNKW